MSRIRHRTSGKGIVQFKPKMGQLGLQRCIAAVAVTLLTTCTFPTEGWYSPHARAVVLLVTPKIFPDFLRPEAAVSRFFAHYDPLISRASETIVILAVGNSDHILGYRGLGHWKDTVEWARTTDHIPVSDQVLDYHGVERMRQAFQAAAASAGLRVKIFEHIDSGSEFTVNNNFKYQFHQECTSNQWGSFDVRARLHADQRAYATAPSGIKEGKLCGEFLADQASKYLADLGFDGIMYDNQLGTRGRWLPENGPGYSVAEARAILAFLNYSNSVLGDKQLMWFDSYNPVAVEQRTFSFPNDGYGRLDYLIASGFCVIMAQIQARDTSAVDHYVQNLASKISISGPPRILATLDYVDPWYSYDSMSDFPQCSDRLEKVAIERRAQIEGVFFFAHDEVGNFVPRERIESFAQLFFAKRDSGH